MRLYPALDASSLTMTQYLYLCQTARAMLRTDEREAAIKKLADHRLQAIIDHINIRS